jgi:hypothetical protein
MVDATHYTNRVLVDKALLFWAVVTKTVVVKAAFLVEVLPLKANRLIEVCVFYLSRLLCAVFVAIGVGCVFPYYFCGLIGNESRCIELI